METRAHAGIAPYNLLVARDLKEFHRVTLGVIAGNDCGTVWQPLNTAGIVKQVFANVLIGHTPDNLALGIHFKDAVAIGAANQRVAVGQPDGGEGPVTLCAASILSRISQLPNRQKRKCNMTAATPMAATAMQEQQHHSDEGA